MLKDNEAKEKQLAAIEKERNDAKAAAEKLKKEVELQREAVAAKE